jgi:amino acid transporter
MCSPAVILSFLVAGFSALLSALCYSEFAAEVSSDLSAMHDYSNIFHNLGYKGPY